LTVLRAMIWIAAPIVVISFFAREYLARLIFARGAPEIAAIFGFLCVAIFFRTMYAIISRYFYAQRDTRTPLLVSLFAIASNIFLAYNLSRTAYGVTGLAMAQSIVATSEVVILFSIMLKRDHKLFNLEFWEGVSRIISASGFTALFTAIAILIFPLQEVDRGFTLILKLSFVSLIAIITHLAASSLFKIEESKPVTKKIKALVLKPIKIN
jgi:putative peptidoglycan lipid II flippase